MMKREIVIAICLLIAFCPLKSQFIGTDIDSSMNFQEVRKGSIVEYSLKSDAVTNDEFRWEVYGGIILTPGATGDGSVANPSRIEFSPDLHTIEVQWNTDDSTSQFIDGSVLVQKRPVAGCISNILKLKIKQWSNPTASIASNFPDFDICSGDSVRGFIVVNFTGAPGFICNYSIKSNGLRNENNRAINAVHRSINTSNDTAHIMLPLILTNPSKASDKYFTIELTSMTDDFQGNGTIVQNKESFTITVYPSVSIGTIQSTRLNRR